MKAVPANGSQDPRPAVTRSSPANADGQSLGRVLDVLGVFTPDRLELSLSQIAELLGWPLPTTHRVATTLLDRGLLRRQPETKQFRLGLGVGRLVSAFLATFVPEGARACLESLTAQTGETASFAILDGTETVYLASCPGAFRLRVEVASGERSPAHCTALGKCLLAQLDPTEARRRLGPGPYPPRTRTTARTWTDLAPRLDAVRSRGYSTSLGEYEDGLVAAAVPVRGLGGGTAGINVSAPQSRMSQKTLINVVVPLLRSASAAIDGVPLPRPG